MPNTNSNADAAMNNSNSPKVSAYTMQSATDDNAKKHIKRNTKSYNKFSYFIQGIDVTQKNLDSMTPYVPGISRLFMHTVPEFMRRQFEDMTLSFKSYVETGYKSVTGIGDVSADVITIEGGWAAQSFSNISKVMDDTDEITITLYEQSGSPVREFIETWMTGMRDPQSGVAHYHGALDADPNLEYGEKNHTCEFIYMDLDPTARYIEYACMFAHAFPTRISKSHLNYESGSRSEVQLDIPFKVTKYEGKYVNDLAYYYLGQQKLRYNYLDFKVFDSSTNIQDSVNYNLELQEDTRWHRNSDSLAGVDRKVDFNEENATDV